MGLLDALNSRDGIFALGLLDAASPKPVRTSIGGGLLQALQNAQAWQQQQEDRAQRAALQGLQMDHLRAQIGETQAQAEQRKAATAEALRKAKAAEALQQRQQQFLAAGGLVGPMAGAGGPSIMAGSGQRTPEQNAQVAGQAQARGFDFATAAALFGPEHAAKLMQGMNDARNFGRDKVAGTVETVMPGTNMPGTMMRDEFGRPVGAVLPKAVEMRLSDVGGALVAVNPFALQVGQQLAKTNSPDAMLSAATTRRGQDMTDARSREKNAIDANAVGKVDWKQDVNGNWIALPKEPSGPGPVNPIMTTVPGKREQMAQNALGVIDQAKGLIDRATGSYAGAGVDQAARVFGVATPGAEVSAQLKALEGALMMAQPRMEGPQSDKDVMLYRQMAGQIGDSTVPASQKKAAIRVIEQLHQRYTAGGEGPPASPVRRYNPTTGRIE